MIKYVHTYIQTYDNLPLKRGTSSYMFIYTLNNSILTCSVNPPVLISAILFLGIFNLIFIKIYMIKNSFRIN